MSFDLRVDIRDPKTGQVIAHQPYTAHLRGDGKFFERPPKSGQFFYEGGEKVPEDQLPLDLRPKQPEKKPEVKVENKLVAKVEAKPEHEEAKVEHKHEFKK